MAGARASLALAVLIATPGAAQPAVVWESRVPEGALRVYSDSSYAVFLNAPNGGEEQWLASGPTALHLNGAWYSAAATGNGSTPSCSTWADVDCQGNDLFYFQATGPADCCANCSATAGCGAWTWTGQTAADPATGALPPWANRCYIKSSCAGRAPYTGHTSGGPGALPLQRVAAGPAANGGWTVTYSAGGVRAFATFSAANGTSGSPFGFSLTFPTGADGVNVTAPVNGSATCDASGAHSRRPLCEFSSSTQPATQFPVWAQPANSSAAAGLGFLTWQGRFFPPSWSNTVGAASAFASAAIGAEGGPIVLFDGNATAGPTRRALVMSPWGHFKSAMIGSGLGGSASAAVGLSGYVTSIPAGFSVTSGLVLGTAGVTDTVHKWGAALRAAYGAPARLPDPAARQLSYYTDNGAFYDWYAYEPDITSAGVPEDILAALSDTFHNGTYPGPPLPIQLLMIDAYWYPNTRANGNCKLSDDVWPVPFPSGLAATASRTGWDLIIYNGPTCGNSTLGAQWPLEYSTYWDQGWGAGVFAAVAPAAAASYYAGLYRQLSADAGGPGRLAMFTQDFLDFQLLIFPAFLQSPEGNGPWMQGEAVAAAAAGVPVEYCMGLPGDMLQSVGLPAVVHARASQDYGAGGSNWKIGGSSLLLSALGLQASKDNAWTTCCGPRGGETSPFLVFAVAALSGGPVGVADALFATDVAVVWPTTTLNGTLLHASRPATAVDAQFLGGASGLPLSNGDVRAAHCAIPTEDAGEPLLFYSVLGADWPNGPGQSLAALVAATDLWPSPPATAGGYWAWSWNTSACATQGAAASDCATALGSLAAPGTAPPPPPDRIAWQLVTVVPVLSNGWVLLGEPAKYVTVSPDRFALVAPAPAGIRVVLAGAPGEVVTLAYVRASGNGTSSGNAASSGATGVAGSVVVAALTLGADGTLDTVLA